MQADNKITFRGTLIWGICAIFFVYEFMTRVMVGSFQTQIMSDIHLSLVEFSLISSTFYQITYGLMQMPVGYLTDRFGLKKALTVAAFCSALAVIIFAHVESFGTAVSARLLLGFGSSFGFVCVLIAVYEWLPRKKVATFMGLSSFIGTMGPMLAAGPLVSLSVEAGIDWRTIFLAVGLIGLVLTVIVVFLVKNNPDPPQEHDFRILKKDMSFLESLKRIMVQKQIWFIAAFAALNYFAIEYLAENEGISFLVTSGCTYGFASYMLTVAWLGYAIGCPILGLTSDLLKRRKPVMISGISMCILSLLTIFYLPANKTMFIISFFFLGIGASSQSLAYALIAEQCPTEYRATALGFTNAFVFVIVASCAPLVGKILSTLQTMQHHVAPTITEYQVAFSVVIAFVVVGLFITIFCIKETFCKMQHSPNLLKVS